MTRNEKSSSDIQTRSLIGLAGLEPGDGLRGCPSDLDQELTGVVDAEAGVGLFDCDGAAGVADPDLDPLPCHGYRAAAADPPIHPQSCSGGCRGGPCWAGTTEPGQLGRGERVRQGPQQGAVVVQQVQDAVVETGS